MKKWKEIVKETPPWDNEVLSNNDDNIRKIIISTIDKLDIEDKNYFTKGRNTFYINRENSDKLIITLIPRNIVNVTNDKTRHSEKFKFTDDNKKEEANRLFDYLKKELK